jgi:benzoyl-CoA reductase/2-hydroxyglutaryl-CoA dehydratase subunit BcrC/BadD/HgdB
MKKQRLKKYGVQLPDLTEFDALAKKEGQSRQKRLKMLIENDLSEKNLLDAVNQYNRGDMARADYTQLIGDLNEARHLRQNA